MSRRHWHLSVFLAVSLVFGSILTLSAPAEAKTALSVGAVDFPISCSAESRKVFNRTLALTHHMMYGQAREGFEALAAKDPDCAMAYWGVAMTLFHPLWAPPGEGDLKTGRQAVERALELKAPTERERAHITAALAFYDNWETTGHGDRIAAWKDAQEKVYLAYSDDVDATAFYALALLAAAPKDDTTYSEQKKAGAILEKLHERAPGHPAGFHYLIHAYDNPLLAKKAVGVARAYDTIAPDVPHALHMPTHIFVRLGLWEDVVSWNTRSAAVALQSPVNGAVSLHYAHAMDYLVYGNLQTGEDGKALEALGKIGEVDRYQDSFASAYAIAAAGGRYSLERSRWNEAANYSLGDLPDFPWEKYPQFEAIAWFTRGLGAARSGDLEKAGNALEKLDSLYDRTVEAGQKYWVTIVNSQRQTVAAWMVYGGGNSIEALVKMRRAADIEDSVDKHPVTPGAVLPARELLGDMLLMERNYPEALNAYEESLKISANRLRSLYGAGRSAELAGHRDVARNHYKKVLEITDGHPSDRPEVKKARVSLENN